MQDWDAVREIKAYPPATGAYALYRKEDFYSTFDHAAQVYSNIGNISVAPIFHEGRFFFCVDTFAVGDVSL